jgi:hypothetical protein
VTKLDWTISRNYASGVDRGVIYPFDGDAEVWNGLISVNEAPSDVSEKVRYIDGRKIVNLTKESSFSATISAFSQPPSFLRNPAAPFDLSYRVSTKDSYRIHLIYNALGRVAGRNYTQQESPEPIALNISTRAVMIPDAAPSAHLIIDASGTYPEALVAIEEVLYGTDAETARFPLPSEILDILDLSAVYKIIDNGDGTFTMEGPDEDFDWVSLTEVVVQWPRVRYLTEDSYRIKSW